MQPQNLPQRSLINLLSQTVKDCLAQIHRDVILFIWNSCQRPPDRYNEVANVSRDAELCAGFLIVGFPAGPMHKYAINNASSVSRTVCTKNCNCHQCNNRRVL